MAAMLEDDGRSSSEGEIQVVGEAGRGKVKRRRRDKKIGDWRRGEEGPKKGKRQECQRMRRANELSVRTRDGPGQAG